MILDIILRFLRQRKAIKIVNDLRQRLIVCDIGCGTDGNFFKKISHSIIQGIGFDKEVNAHRNSKVELKKINLDKEKLPLKKETINVVTMLAVLEHLENPENILSEIIRILKTDGILILTTPSLKAKPILEFLVKLKMINRKGISEHKKYYSTIELKDLLFKSGFQEKNINIEYFEFGLNILATVKK